MTLFKLSAPFVAALTLCVCQPTLLYGATTDKPTAHKSAATSTATSTSEDEIRAILHDEEMAINAGNVEQTASYWSPDAILIDADGNTVTGHDAIRDRFANAFKAEAPPHVGLHPTRIMTPSANVAVITGDISRAVGDVLSPSTRFSMVLQKENGKWLIKQATETKIENDMPIAHLSELSWLLGKWKVADGDSNTKLDVSWDEGKNFLHSKYITQDKNAATHVDNQIIGWDPRRECIVSWHFDSHGAFGYSQWHKSPDGWIVEFTGVSPRGEETRATSIIKTDGKDQFSWQSREQKSGDTTVPDSPAVSVVREK